jgi:hypothetical protein
MVDVQPQLGTSVPLVASMPDENNVLSSSASVDSEITQPMVHTQPQETPL